MGPRGGVRKLILGSKCLGIQINCPLCTANSFSLSSIARYQPVSGYAGGNMPLGAAGEPGWLAGLSVAETRGGQTGESPEGWCLWDRAVWRNGS